MKLQNIFLAFLTVASFVNIAMEVGELDEKKNVLTTVSSDILDEETVLAVEKGTYLQMFLRELDILIQKKEVVIQDYQSKIREINQLITQLRNNPMMDEDPYVIVELKEKKKVLFNKVRNYVIGAPIPLDWTFYDYVNHLANCFTFDPEIIGWIKEAFSNIEINIKDPARGKLAFG